MREFLKGTAWTLVGLAFFSGIASERARYAARRDLERAIPDSRFEVAIQPRGLLGYVTGDLESARITGRGFTIEQLPFTIEPRGGIHARLAKLELKLQDVSVRALPLQSLEAVIPGVRVDAARVLFNGHFTIRAAGEGIGEAVISESGLSQFIARKRPEFSDLNVTLQPGEALVRGRATLLIAPAPIEARVTLGVSEGRYLNAVEAAVKLNGQAVPAALTERLLQSLNPIIDVERDLGLGQWLYATGVAVEHGILKVRARVSIPLKSTSPPGRP